MAGELYDDGLVVLDERGLTLRRYYFPLGTSKRIEYADVRGVTECTIGTWTGRYRLWGSGDLRHWAPLDTHRSAKRSAIVLDLGGTVRPWFTPDDVGRVMSLLRERVPQI